MAIERSRRAGVARVGAAIAVGGMVARRDSGGMALAGATSGDEVAALGGELAALGESDTAGRRDSETKVAAGQA
jgi:hypothetical protein